MGTCTCEPPATLHIRPDGVHLPDGGRSPLVVDDGAGLDLDAPPRCSVCGQAITDTHFVCVLCTATICRRCVSLDTAVVECDCDVAVPVTGVLRAARLAAAALG